MKLYFWKISTFFVGNVYIFLLFPQNISAVFFFPEFDKWICGENAIFNLFSELN